MDDYDITVTPGATLTVQKSATEITVTAKSRSWTYDGAPHVLHEYDATNLDILQPGDELEVTFSADSVVTTPLDGEVENKIVSVKVLRTTGGQQQDVSANYTLAAYPGTLKVTKRPVTLTSKGASKAYDGTVLTKHEVEVGGDGFVGEDGATYTFSGSQLDKGTSKNAFEYSLKGGTNAAYYEITKVEGDLEVFPADISAGTEPDWEIVLGPELTYNGIAQIQTVTSAKFKGIDLDYTVSGNQQTDAGDYELTLAGQGNFTGTKTVAWKLNPKALTLTAGSGSKPYDGTPLMFDAVTADGFVAGESATYACTGSQLDVGSSENVVTTINWTEAKAGNYAVTKKPGTLAVTPRAVTSKNISKPFDGTPLKLTASDISVSCGGQGLPTLPAGESFVYSDFAERTEAGQTSGTFSIAAGTNTKLANYAIAPVYGTITITKSAAEIGVTARSKSWPYDATTHELHEYDATNLNILQQGEELVVMFKEASKVTTPKDGPGEDGKVANEIESIRVVKNGSQDVTANYTVTAYPGVLTVTKRKVTVNVTGKTVSATYDGEEHTASGYDIATEDELYDIVAKTTFGGTDEVKRTDAGKSEMGLKPADFTNADDYFDVTYAVTDGWVDIAQADISTSEDTDFILSLGANPKYNGTVQTILVTAVTYKNLPVTYALAGENATHAGTYTLTVKANGNFKGERSTTWKILKRQVKLTSGSASRAYNGQPLVNGDVAVSGDGSIGIEGATYSVTGSQTLVGSSKNAFSYTLKAGTQEGDYDIEKVEGNLIVTKAKVSGGGEEPGTGEIPEGGHSKFDETYVYDGEGHTIKTNELVAAYKAALVGEFAVQYAVGESGGQGLPALPPTNAGAWGTVAPAYTNVGEYVVWYKVSSANYEDFVHQAKVTITPKPLAVTAEAKTQVYGAAAKPLTYTTDGLIAGDALTGALTREPGDGVGEYDILQGTLANGNYTISYTGAKYTITKGTIPGGGEEPGTGDIPEGGLSKFDATYVYDGEGHTIKTNELVAAYKVSLVGEFAVSYAVGGSGGQGLPALPPTDVGAWGTVAPVYTNVGEYVIWYKVTSANYEDFVHQAKVTITPKPLAVTAEAKTQVYGTAAKPLTYTVDGLIAGDALTGALTREPGNGAGEYDILQGTLANGNYTISYTGAKYTITKAKYPGQETGGAGIQWNVAADAATWMYDGETHGITLTGVPNGVTPHLTGNAAKDVGEYTASVTFDFDTANYEAPKVPAPLAWSITKRPLSLQTVSVEKPYDGFPLMVEKANITPGLSGYAEGECFDYFDLASITEVGETPATFQYRDSATAKVSNYAVSVVGGATLKVTVGGDQISVTAKDGVWAYDGTGHRLAEWTIVNGDKLLAGHAFQIKISDDSVVTTPRDGVHADGIVSNRFEYVKIIETKSGADKTKNYNLFVYDGTLQMTNRVICSEELRVNSEEFGERIEKTYDGRATNVTVTAELLQPATVRYGESVDDISSTTEPEFTDAGEYVVWYTVAADYYNTYTNKVTVKINLRPITLTSPTKAKPYDGTALTFGAQELEVTYTGGTLGDRALPDGESLVFSNFASIVDAGRVDATFEYAAGVGTKLDNYEVTVKKGTLTVNASADEITLTAKSGSWPYDATAHTLHAYDVEKGDVLRPGDELVVEYDEASWSGLAENVVFTVAAGGAGGMEPASFTVMGYLGEYDGRSHTITVEVTGGDGSFTVTYAESQEGPWSNTAPSYVAAGEYTIWYRVSSPNYASVSGSAKVNIFESSGGDAKDWVDVPMEIGGKAFQIPFAWFVAQPGLGAKFGTDWQKTAFAKTGKHGSDGTELCVWHDFVAGTDPTNVNSRLTANIRMENDVPVVTWRPALNGEGVKRGARIYRVDGKVKLEDGAWAPDVDEKRGTWRFFRVRVEMP